VLSAVANRFAAPEITDHEADFRNKIGTMQTSRCAQL